MADRSSIEWTQVTWNPVTGCDRITPGCDLLLRAHLLQPAAGDGQPKYRNYGHRADGTETVRPFRGLRKP